MRPVADIRRWFAIVMAASGVLIVIVTFSGCQSTTGGQARLAGEEGHDKSEQKIRADAYSFNARIWRDGKPTTFKLEVYQTDPLIGLSGRGYLGKGALKGWISEDSIRIYFPTTHELLYKAMADLDSGQDCPLPLGVIDVLSLLRSLPDSADTTGSIVISGDYSQESRPRFEIKSTDLACPWQVEAWYDFKNDAWRIRKVLFDDGRKTRLRLELDRFRAGARVPADRFRVVIPDGVIPVSL